MAVLQFLGKSIKGIKSKFTSELTIQRDFTFIDDANILLFIDRIEIHFINKKDIFIFLENSFTMVFLSSILKNFASNFNRFLKRWS